MTARSAVNAVETRPGTQPASPAENGKGTQMLRSALRAAGIIGGAGGAFAASAAGQAVVAVGVLALAALALAGDLLAAMLRDQTFRRIATRPRPDPRVLRELNIREAIRSGQLASEDAASLLSNEPRSRAH